MASIACLKRALYLDPFEWIISYNLGLVHLNTGQYASAFHYFSTSINLKPDFPSSYMYLAITLNRLDDFDNACQAYEKAIEMEEDHLFRLNYAITLINNDDAPRAAQHFAEFELLFEKLDDEAKTADPEVNEQRMGLHAALKTAGHNVPLRARVKSAAAAAPTGGGDGGDGGGGGGSSRALGGDGGPTPPPPMPTANGGAG